MKLLSDHLLNLAEYAVCLGYNQPFKSIKKGTYIETSTYLDYFQELLNKQQDEYFGLRYGFFLNLTALGSVYNISLSTTSIEQTIKLWASYSDTNMPIINFSSFLKDNRFYLVLNSEIEDVNIRNQVLDSFFAFVFRELKLIVGKDVLNIHLPYKDLEFYQKWYKCKIEYSDNHCFSFHDEILKADINLRNKKAIELVLPKFLTMLESKVYKNKPFSFLVRKMILNMCKPELPSLKQVASQFIMTERTLQRKLKKEKMSFRKISNATKRELFFYLKGGKPIKTQDIAYILGYSCSSAFIHANKNWDQKK